MSEHGSGQGGTATAPALNPRDIVNRFRFKAPTTEQIRKINAVNEVARELGNAILANTPAGYDQTFCLEQLWETVQMVEGAIVYGEGG